jgi:hypothetical protein
LQEQGAAAAADDAAADDDDDDDDDDAHHCLVELSLQGAGAGRDCLVPLQLQPLARQSQSGVAALEPIQEEWG